MHGSLFRYLKSKLKVTLDMILTPRHTMYIIWYFWNFKFNINGFMKFIFILCADRFYFCISGNSAQNFCASFPKSCKISQRNVEIWQSYSLDAILWLLIKTKFTADQNALDQSILYFKKTKPEKNIYMYLFQFSFFYFFLIFWFTTVRWRSLFLVLLFLFLLFLLFIFVFQ